MSKITFRQISLLLGCLLSPLFVFAWDAEGHKMVANIAKDKLNPGVEAKVQKYFNLDATTFENAAVWMDEIK